MPRGLQMAVMTGLKHLVKIVGAQLNPKGNEIQVKYSPRILNVKYFLIYG